MRSKLLGMIKRLLIILVVVLVPLCAVAQKKGFKRVECVPKQKPAWVTEAERKDYYYIQNQEGATLTEAKNIAMTEVLNSICRSVAVTVTGVMIDEGTVDVVGDEQVFRESFTSRTQTKIAKLPAIQGISDQKADVYYEHYYKKKTGEEYYVVCLRYPFNEFERRDLLDAYNKQEQFINDEIDRYDDEVEVVGSVEAINKNISGLNLLKKELIDDDSRVERINAIIKLYTDILKSLTVELMENRPGFMSVRLTYKGKVITTSRKPKVTSDCANDFDVRYDKDKWTVAFNSEYCYEQDDPTVKIVFTAGNSKPTKQVRIKFR